MYSQPETNPDDAPLFTVIVPVFNRRELIADTLNSIKQQSFEDFELILVDDGSTDGSADYIRGQGFAVLEQENSGPGSARNNAARLAKGKYLAFLDSDDRWFPNTLQLYADTVRAHHEPAFITGSPVVFTDRRAAPDLPSAQPSVQVFSDYYGSSDKMRWHGVSSFVIRRDVFNEAGGFCSGRINGEDAELAMRLGTATGFVHVASPPTFAYLSHAGNVTLDSAKSEAGLRLLIGGERSQKFPGGKVRAEQRREIITRHVRPFILECCSKGDFIKAMKHYRQIFLWSLSQRRVKFLCVAPLLALCGAILRLFSSLSPRSKKNNF